METSYDLTAGLIGLYPEGFLRIGTGRMPGLMTQYPVLMTLCLLKDQEIIKNSFSNKAEWA